MQPQGTGQSVLAISRLWSAETFDGTATNCDRRAGTLGRTTSLPPRNNKRTNHETRNIGLGDRADIHGWFRARAVRRRLHGRKFGHGRRGGDRHDGWVFHRRNDNRKFDRCQQRHVERRRQRRSRTGQRAQSVGEHQYQPLTQRLDPDAGAYRQIRKSPASRGFFYAHWRGLLTFIALISPSDEPERR